MNKKVKISLFLIVISISFGFTSIIFQSNTSKTQPENTIKTSGLYQKKAEWKYSGGQPYLNIIAKNHYELGRLQGEYAKDQILYADYVVKSLIASYNLSLDFLMPFVYLYALNIPIQYQLLILGTADAILELGYEDILLQHIFIDMFYGILQPLMVNLPNLKIAGCTALGLKSEDRIIIGQNMDFGLIFSPAIYWVNYKLPFKPEVFSIRLGAMALPIGTNRKVSSLITLVQTTKICKFNIPISIASYKAFEKAKNKEVFLDTLFESRTCTWNFIVSDKKGIITSEALPDDEVIEDVDKYAVKTNTYLTESFKPYLLNPYFSLERQAKATELSAIAISDMAIELNEVMNILSYYDGTEASILRPPDFSHPENTCTLSYFSHDIKTQKGYFGLGNVAIENWGVIP
ncbi:MAG: hypothetical protein GF317_14250 [Candidatus Lokiarchaeota archaeon]|nr:hypothetical protein [Candidatus Lokiarchaeota archaeon]MBD3200778.1 hypothetical protein [Candidatus Lokiarchaeota archaeon]